MKKSKTQQQEETPSPKNKAALQNGKNELLKKRIYDLEEKLKHYHDIDERINQLKVLIQINTYITNSLEKEEILNRILNQVKALLDCENSTILLVNEELQQLEFAILTKEEDSEILKDTRLKLGEGIAGTVWQSGTPTIINDTSNDPRFSNRADKKTKMQTRSIIAVPLTVDGKIIGVIEALNKNKRGFNDFDLQILQYISTQSAIAIKNANLYNMATRDGMTRLYIHKYFKERLVEEFKRTQRKRRSFSLVMYDIDHFKSMNDTYGHQAGDMVLKEVAKVIQENSRAIDIPARYGGEEFAVILPETSLESAKVFAERIRKKIENLRIEYQDSIIQVTISGGVASTDEYPPRDSEELIKHADNALYCSKEQGRNMTTSYKPK